MKPTAILLTTSTLLLIAATGALAQGASPNAGMSPNDRARQNEFEQMQPMLQRVDAYNESVRDEREIRARSMPRPLSKTDLTAIEKEQERIRLGLAFREFYTGFEAMSKALDANTPVKKGAGMIRNGSKPFLEVVKLENGKNHSRFDAAEFKGLGDAELARETLKTADRIALSLIAVAKGEVQAHLDLSPTSPLLQLELDLTRLQWMTGRLD